MLRELRPVEQFVVGIRLRLFGVSLFTLLLLKSFISFGDKAANWTIRIKETALIAWMHLFILVIVIAIVIAIVIFIVVIIIIVIILVIILVFGIVIIQLVLWQRLFNNRLFR